MTKSTPTLCERASLEGSPMIRPIVTKDDHREALDRIAALAAKGARTDVERAELRALTLLVHDFEKPARDELAALLAESDDDDAVDAIEYALERAGLTRKDLEPFIGSRSRVFEVMTRKRGLSIEMIRKLHAGLQIPLDYLIRKTKRSTRSSAATRTSARPGAKPARSTRAISKKAAPASRRNTKA
jgi:HTH-type transcriptional regulator/antitoxin HigA